MKIKSHSAVPIFSAKMKPKSLLVNPNTELILIYFNIYQDIYMHTMIRTLFHIHTKQITYVTTQFISGFYLELSFHFIHISFLH